MKELEILENSIAGNKEAEHIFKLIKDWIHLNPDSDFKTALKEAILFYTLWGWLFCNTLE